ncbi:tetratricopeptide repeat protein [Methanosarcina sp. Mfa9]|uniref:tetratricopeptide repeat protein n=1 Tax=Methanosarcina sp. Mfa9 TaxID=3439063 RepID=UPI003F86DE77
MELDPKHISKIEKLTVLLELSEDCTIVFVRCNEPVLCKAIFREISERVSDGVFIYSLKMDETSTDLFYLLKQATESEIYNSRKEKNGKIAFFVSGLDSAAKKKNSEGKSEALLLMNLMRDRYLEIKHPIIIWLNSSSLNLVLKEAPDFFSWRTAVFEFDLKKEIASIPTIPVFEFEKFINKTKSDLENLSTYYQNSIEEYEERQIYDPYKFARLYFNLGTIELFSGMSKEAIEYLKTAESISSGINNRNLKEYIYNQLGIAYYHLGNPQKAQENIEHALQIAKEINDIKGTGNILGNLGIIYEELGDANKASGYYEEALEISREFPDPRGEANTLGNMGNSLNRQGKTKKAIEYYEHALKITRKIGDQHGEAIHLSNLGHAYGQLGEIEKALEYHENALKMTREIGDRRGEGNALGNLGNVYYILGENGKAIEFLKQSLAIGKAIEDPRIISFCEQKLRDLEGSDD